MIQVADWQEDDTGEALWMVYPPFYWVLELEKGRRGREKKRRGLERNVEAAIP